ACADLLFPQWQVPDSGDAARSAEAVRLLGEARAAYGAGIDAIAGALVAIGDVAPEAVIAAAAPGAVVSECAGAGGERGACTCGGVPSAAREVRVEEKAGFLVAGCYYRGKNEHGEVPALWDNQFIPRWHELRRPPFNGTACYGLERMPDVGAEEFEYVACLAVQTLAGLPAGMVGWQVPGGAYAVTVADNVRDLRVAFEYVYHDWLPRSRHWTLREGPCVEYYPPTFPVDGIVEVWVPVRPL
ncbi:MAG: GyrI-like domain-containing protein, partial [Anaerolineae bacterium]